MKKIILGVLVVAAVVSCKKDEMVVPSAPAKKLIKFKVTSDNQNEALNIGYGENYSDLSNVQPPFPWEISDSIEVGKDYGLWVNNGVLSSNETITLTLEMRNSDNSIIKDTTYTVSTNANGVIYTTL